MTRLGKSALTLRKRAANVRDGYWLLQDAKARFSDLVRRVKSEGPQYVTVRGREEVVVISVDEFRKLTSNRTGKVLTAAMQSSPYREMIIDPPRVRARVRSVVL